MLTPPLNRTTTLRRVADITFRLDSAGGLVVNGRPVGSWGLAILHALATPRTVAEVVEELAAGATGAVDFAELASTVQTLYRVGALARADTMDSLRGDCSFEGALSHRNMLGDARRTKAFIKALEAVVGPDDVVLDLGCGTGILAMAAARAGAKSVYAVEATRMASVAERILSLNGFEDRVTVVRGWSSRVNLEEKVTVIVSETIGNDPFEEGVLPALWDAVRRLGVPEVRVVPARIRLFAVPVSMPAAERKQLLDERSLAQWKDLYGFDFSPLLEASRATVVTVMARASARKWKSLSPPVLLAQVEPGRHSGVVRASGEAQIDRRGTLHAILTYFELELAPGVSISTHPDLESHWGRPAYLLGESRKVAPGQRISFTYDSSALPRVTVR